MDENLSEMVKQPGEGNNLFNVDDLELPRNEETPNGQLENLNEQQENTPPFNISMINFTDWCNSNLDRFNNINKVSVDIRGVDSKSTIIFSVLDPKGGKDDRGNDKRKLQVFENADQFLVPNLDGQKMNVYSNGFEVLYQYNEEIFLKCYAIKTGLIVTFCIQHNDKLIPFDQIKVKKSEIGFNVPSVDQAEIISKLANNANKENLQILYKQISKQIDTLNTNNDVFEWLYERQINMNDLNHLVQIDSVMLTLVK